MKKKVMSLMLALLAMIIMAAPAVAGEREGAFSVSPFVGGYTFDGHQHVKTSPVFGLRLGYDLTKNWGVEAVGNYQSTKGTGGGQSINAMSYRLDVLYNLMADGPLVPYVAVGGGGITAGHGNNGFKIRGENTDATANAGLGLKYFVTDSIALRGDARQLFIFEEHNSIMYNWEYTAGLTFLFGGKTETVAVVAPVPPPAPTSTLTFSPDSIEHGQPTTLSWASQDTTNCDIQPSIGSVATQGSMAITPVADTDYTLSCSGPGGTTNSTASIRVAAPFVAPLPKAVLTVDPGSITQGQTAKLSWSSQDATNCDIQPNIGPVQPMGSMDINPTTDTAYTIVCSGDGGTASGTANISVIAPPPPVPTPEELCVTLHIEFATGKSAIPAKSHDDIAKVADFMKKYPQVKGVIEGHTDTKGPATLNMKLSLRRAQSVKNYLVKKLGIDSSRLTVKGYGFTKPVADNGTAEGRRQNRRIVANFDCVEKVK